MKGEADWKIILSIVLVLIVIGIAIAWTITQFKTSNTTSNTFVCKNKFELWCTDKYIRQNGPSLWDPSQPGNDCVTASTASDLCNQCKKSIPSIEC